MNFDTINSFLITEKSTLLNGIIIDEYLTKGQVEEILRNAMTLTDRDSHYGVRKAVNKLLFVIDFLKKFGIREENKAMYDNTIQRLSKAGGEEVLNELITHVALWNILPNYKVAPLFENFADGYLVDGDLEIPVEIKSRFPEIFDTIENFANSFRKLNLIQQNLDIAFHIDIERISNFEISHYLEEVQINAAAFNTLPVDLTKPFPQYFSIERKTNPIDYSVRVRVSLPPENRTIIGVYDNDELAKKSFVFSVFAKRTGKICPGTDRELTGATHTLYLTVSESVKDELAKRVIKRGIKNITNLPPEPRIIVFFSTRFNEFAQKYCDAYINTRRKTAFVGIEPDPNSFDDDRNIGFRVPVIKAGTEIQIILEKNLNIPTLLK